MMVKRWIAVACLGFALSGCAQVKGQWFLAKEQYRSGIHALKEELRKNPNDPAANYYMGRFYLALEKPEQSLPYLRKATRYRPSKADYYFWLGVAYWGVRDFEQESYAYEKALNRNVKHIPARLYLAHNLLDSGEMKKALKQYDKVLKKDPKNPEALYNKGLALKDLNRAVEEIGAWEMYLQYYPEGKWALRAVDHLNARGEFSYRNFQIGHRRVTLERIGFSSGSSTLLSSAEPSLKVVGSIMSINKRIEIKIVAYKKGNPSLAEARAKAIKEYLVRHYSEIRPSRISTKAAGSEEKVVTKARLYLLDDAISFVTTKK
jgi:tetratricopeptide (TPR) repeat protein